MPPCDQHHHAGSVEFHETPDEPTLLLVARLALFVEKRADVLRQFSPEELDACRFRIRTHYLVRGRNSWRFVIHDLLL